MPSVMYQFYYNQNPKPTIDDIAQYFSIPVSQIDADFGVIATDPDANLYTILVDDSIEDKLQNALGNNKENDSSTGGFSNPRIEPFGPPED